MKNKKHIIGVISTLLLGSTSVFAQIGIGTNSPNKSTALEVEGQEKGVLIPLFYQGISNYYNEFFYQLNRNLIGISQFKND